MDFDSSMQILYGKLLESNFICIKPQVDIMSKPVAVVILVQRPFLPTILRHLILAHWAVFHLESNSDMS
jgi:hypothetical protein